MRSEDFFDKFDKGLAGDDQDTMLWAAEDESMQAAYFTDTVKGGEILWEKK